MRPRAVIVGSVLGERASEMPLIEDDHVIETLSTNGADQALDKWIVPGTLWTRDDFVDACWSRIRCQAATGSWTRSLQWETQRTWFRSAGTAVCPLAKASGVWPSNDAWRRAAL